jgi:hypothetical protein
MDDSHTVSDETAAEHEVWVWPDDPRTWDILGDPERESVKSYATLRTFLVRWHRGTGGWEPISHFEDYTDLQIDDRVTVRVYGRIIYDGGEDVTAEYVESSSRNKPA